MSDNDLQQGVHMPSDPHIVAMTSHNLGGPHIQTYMIITATKKAMWWIGHNMTHDGLRATAISTYTGSEPGYVAGLPCWARELTLVHKAMKSRRWEMKLNQAVAYIQDTPWESPGSNSSLNRGNRSSRRLRFAHNPKSNYWQTWN